MFNVMSVYSGIEFYEYIRLDVNIGDQSWIFRVECDVCVQWNWSLRILPNRCEYLRPIVNIPRWMWCVCTAEVNFYECFRLDVNICDRLWIYPIECDVWVQSIFILRIFSIGCEYLRSNLIEVYSGCVVQGWFS